MTRALLKPSGVRWLPAFAHLLTEHIQPWEKPGILPMPWAAEKPPTAMWVEATATHGLPFCWSLGAILQILPFPGSAVTFPTGAFPTLYVCSYLPII